MKKVLKLLKITLLLLLSLNLSGCLLAAVGAGAAGGAYIDKHYHVTLKAKKKE